MTQETVIARTNRILNSFNEKFPGKSAYDLDGRGLHFVCEVEPVSEHPEFDRAIEVIFSSMPHKHLKMTQWYTVISGLLKLCLDSKEITLKAGEKYTVKPGVVHCAESVGDTECWVEIYSEPGWTKEDHIKVE